MGDSPGETIEALHRVASSLQSQDSIERACELTVKAATEVLEFKLCTVLIREDEWLIPYANSREAPPDGSRQMCLDQGLAGKTYQSGNSQLVEKVESDDETDPAKSSYRSGISVPIGEHGIFQAVGTDEAAFSKDDIELAELLLSHTKTALDRIEREQELKQQVERLDQFASVVSHDLRNPLSVAQGHLELARDANDNNHLRKIAAAHERMDTLIDDMLIFARAGSEAINEENVELAQFIKNCWKSIEQKNATLNVKTEQQIRADRNRLHQLIENLLSNAVQYGGSEVSIKVGDIEGGFYVEDDGPGIPVDERSPIFDAGYSPGTKGDGFGLSIAKQVAEAHGWKLYVVEGCGSGARFEITGIETTTE